MMIGAVVVGLILAVNQINRKWNVPNVLSRVIVSGVATSMALVICAVIGLNATAGYVRAKLVHALRKVHEGSYNVFVDGKAIANSDELVRQVEAIYPMPPRHKKNGKALNVEFRTKTASIVLILVEEQSSDPIFHVFWPSEYGNNELGVIDSAFLKSASAREP